MSFYFKATVALVVLISGISCSQTDQSTSATDVIESEEVNETANQQEGSASNSSDDPVASEFVEQELAQLSSPFTKETVLELNAIVGKSLSAIEAFDLIRKESSDGTEQEQLRKLDELSKTARQAKQEMDASSERLRTSGEKHNEAIFAAMVKFVEGVDEEISEEIELRQKR